MKEVMIFILNCMITIITSCFDWAKELFMSMVNFLPEFVSGILPFLGIEDVINSSVLYAAILFLASALGIYISVRKRKKIWTFACGLVGIYSTISLMKSK